MNHSPISFVLSGFIEIFYSRLDSGRFWSEFKTSCLEQTLLAMATDDGPIGRYGTIHYMKRLEDVPLVSYPVDDDTVTFGRSDDVVACQIRLYDLWASGRHCQLIFDDGKVLVSSITSWFSWLIHPSRPFSASMDKTVSPSMAPTICHQRTNYHQPQYHSQMAPSSSFTSAASSSNIRQKKNARSFWQHRVPSHASRLGCPW